MLESDRTLRHLAFFEELAALDESDAEWRSVSAGLVVLRLVDTWMEDGCSAVTADDWGLRAVRAAIEEVPDSAPVRALLATVVDALEESRIPDMSVVAPRLLAYGRALEYDARYALAADVYRAVIAHTHPVEESDVATAAYFQLAFCLRTSGNCTAAADAYRVAGEIALASDDFVGVLRARIGDAKIAIERGNLPRAEELLDQTIAESARRGFDDIRSRALHDRSAVAFFRGDYETAVKFAYDALQANRNTADRDRILSDLATSFMKLGVLSAARDAYLVLSVTAREQFTRWIATINLMEIASRSGSETLFERYRRELAEVSLPPMLSVDYYIQTGEGYQRLRRTDLARGYLQRALSIASDHNFNQLVFYVEEALQGIASAEPVAPVSEAQSPQELQEIAGAIRQLRETAGSAG